MDFILIATIITKDGLRFDVKQLPGEDADEFNSRLNNVHTRLPGDRLSVRRMRPEPWMMADNN